MFQKIKTIYFGFTLFFSLAVLSDSFEYNNYTKPYSIAAVTSYKQSVMLNNLFRTIKENANLDLLEESDDEEEFENIAEDKYVDLKKEISFKCVYLKYYKSWKPLVQMNGDICHEKDILNIEKYNNK